VAFDVRPCRNRDELVRAYYSIGQYFGAPPEEERTDRFVQYFELERMHAAFDGDQIVGGAGAFSYDFTVPGGSLPCAGVTVVGVYPTHRRRGALRAMMLAQLADVHERDEPIAALWASEETIYGRFGYGIASWACEMTLPRVWSAFAQPLERRGRVRFVSPEEGMELFPPIWDALRRERPGVPSRSEAWWKLRSLRIPDEEKANPRRFVALDLDGSTQAYAIYRREPGWQDGSSSAKLDVQEAIGATPQATAEIWRYLLDVDWTETISAYGLPLDHPLFLLLANPRRARMRTADSLWVRLVDVGAALSGRAYAGAGAVVLDVRDSVCPWNEGRWVVEAGEAKRTDAEPDIALDVSSLGSAYLGAVSFGELRSALRVEELKEGAVERADALFGWRPLPWCPEIF
jgi:predicted acetyltransferase